MKNIAWTQTLRGGGLKESSFNSKKIVLSLATISFLASYANASGTTDGCPTASTQARSSGSSSNYNCTITSLYNSGTVGITLSNYQTSTLTIESGGTLQAPGYPTGNGGNGGNGVNSITLKGSNSDTRTLEKLINQGTIKGKIGIENENTSFNGTITVRTFDNKKNGFIDGHIYMGIWQGNGGTISIENFTNEGTITIPNYNNHNDGVIYFEGTTHIKTFHNKGTIEGSGKNSISLKAQGNQTPTLENFINDGTIKGRMVIENRGQNGQSFQGTITVKTFENKNNGIIDGDIYIGMWGGSRGTISIENFKNSGTIKGGSRQGVYFEDIRSAIKTFENTGFISGSGDSSLAGGLHTGGGVVMTGGTIETFKNSGTIQSTGTNHYPGGVKLNYATVKTFENTGLISGISGGFITIKGTIENFINKGTIEATGQGGGEAAIRIHTAELQFSSITNFTNTGTIKSNSNGVLIESGNKIGTLTNQGVIESKLNGIDFIDDGGHSSPDNAELGKIVLESGSSIKAEKKGINIDNQTAKTITTNGIEVKAGASVSGDEAGIYLGKGKEITAPITVSGTVSGGNAGIVNEGSITAPITISGTVSGGNAGIVNESEGRMARGITHNGEGELVISNQGLVGKDDEGNTVTNNKGNVTIKDWVVSTNEETGKLDTVVVGGTKTDSVKVSNITVDQSGLELEELNEIKNLISGVSTNNIANVKTNGGGEISLSYDPISARLSTDVQLNASIAGANFRSSVATASKRATFIDNVMANAMQSFSLDSSGKSQKIALSEKGNLYADASDYIKNDYIKSDLTQANYGLNKEHALFILPYFSSQSVELSLNEESKGHTKGTIIGYSTLKDSGIYGVYAGYEDTKMDSTYFDVNNISYYTGLKYFNTLFTTAKGQEVYIKAQAQAALIKNDFTKKIGKNEAKAKAHSYTYGINTAWGMNFIADKNIFSPEAGFAYEGSYTEAFSMQDTRGKATVKGGERTYANHLNLFSTKTSFTWFRDWLPNLKTSVELGAKFNVNPKVKARARFGNMKVNDEFHLPRVRKFASTSLIVPVNEAFYFSLNYNGMFDEKGNTHTGFAQFNYLW
ncbi:autotransporter beta-domain protein [Campylobacter jejuni subsp. doylei 269.97]|uniref:Autotransporter beta-domain protein n=1 Tax=Campylobacter jejuni subsp. doylei (strain ATCC BAA-1458 / RM4099 / 269.97) TaxID=360109 RepID=A7H3Q6_CAMJD|nr:autotransporter beta-domain protein [Campylobacter jejuni subsp. doylei 269.97]